MNLRREVRSHDSKAPKRKVKESGKRLNEKKLCISASSNHDSEDDAFLQDTLKSLKTSGHLCSEALSRLSSVTPFDSFCTNALSWIGTKEGAHQKLDDAVLVLPKMQAETVGLFERIEGEGSYSGPCKLKKLTESSSLGPCDKICSQKNEASYSLCNGSQEGRASNSTGKGMDKRCLRSVPSTLHKNNEISLASHSSRNSGKSSLSEPASLHVDQGKAATKDKLLPNTNEYNTTECFVRSIHSTSSDHKTTVVCGMKSQGENRSASRRDFWSAPIESGANFESKVSPCVTMPNDCLLKPLLNNIGTKISSSCGKPVQSSLQVPLTLLMTKEKTIRAFSPSRSTSKLLRINAYGKYIPAAEENCKARSSRSKTPMDFPNFSPDRCASKKQIIRDRFISDSEPVSNEVLPRAATMKKSSLECSQSPNFIEDDSVSDDVFYASTDEDLTSGSIRKSNNSSVLKKRLSSRMKRQDEPELNFDICHARPLPNSEHSNIVTLREPEEVTSASSRKSSFKIKKRNDKAEGKPLRKCVDIKTSHPRRIQKVCSLSDSYISQSSKGIRKQKKQKKKWFINIRSLVKPKTKEVVVPSSSSTTDDEFPQDSLEKDEKDKVAVANEQALPDAFITEAKKASTLTSRSCDSKTNVPLERMASFHHDGAKFEAGIAASDELPLPSSRVMSLFNSTVSSAEANFSERKHNLTFCETLTSRESSTASFYVPDVTAVPLEKSSVSCPIQKPVISLVDVFPELTAAQKHQFCMRSKVSKMAKSESLAVKTNRKVVPLPFNMRNRRPKRLGMLLEDDSNFQSVRLRRRPHFASVKRNLRKRKSVSGIYREVDSPSELDNTEREGDFPENCVEASNTDLPTGDNVQNHRQGDFLSDTDVNDVNKRPEIRLLATDQQTSKHEVASYSNLTLRTFQDIYVKKFEGYNEIVIATGRRTKKVTDGAFKSEYNFLDVASLRELLTALKLCQRMKKCKAVLLSSVGPIFCSGLNPKVLLDWELSLEGSLDVVSLVHTVVDLLIDFKKPVLAAVQGPAVGFGASILLFCDAVYASDRLSIQWPGVSMGLSMCGCASSILPMQVGPLRARSLLINGDILTAREAKDRGLVCEIFPHDSLARNVVAACRQLVASPSLALLNSKKLLFTRDREILKKCNAKEIALLKQCLRSTESQDSLRDHISTQLIVR